ncbi:hypothetical protein D9757_009065 [Collybiopsis confluens]|uniref:F-box domain-containing protein n=1 Tax=Collybiopsis confluens TaxID=2823264 RepID=A0A8H5HED3_9AGAR|nr:hypothetical protein D9757_009065 [Collybiopsis confluens]
MSNVDSLQKLTQNAISALDVLTQKLGVHDDEPMLERLRQGELPLPQSFMADINSFRRDGALRLVEFDQSIIEVEEAVQRMKKARNGFDGSLNVANSLFAPVRRLSEDVLIQIFSIYIEDQGEYSCNLTTTYISRTRTARARVKRHIRSATLHLSRVCSVWRRIVFSRPSFWSTLQLNMGGLVHESTRRAGGFLSIVSEHLSRSIPVR